jgi:hypothetical protein
MPLNLNSDKLIVVCKPDQQPIQYTGYTATVLIGSGDTTVTNISGATWIIHSNTGTTGAITTLVGSGGTWAGLISGDTWVVYSPDWTADILGLTMSAQTAYECCTGNTADIAYISGVTDNHYDSFTGLSSYVINLLVPAISGNTNDINYLSGQTEIAQQCCTGLTASFDTYTGVTAPASFFPISGYSFVESGSTQISVVGNEVTIYSATGGTGAATVLVGSGATVVDNISGTTWIVYSPTGSTGGGVSEATFTGYTGVTAPATYAPLLASIKVVTGTTYTALTADIGKVIEFTATGATTLTLPTGLTVGYQFTAVNVGGQVITFTAGGGITLYSKSSAVKLESAYAGASAYYRASGKWVIIGDLT